MAPQSREKQHSCRMCKAGESGRKRGAGWRKVGNAVGSATALGLRLRPSLCVFVDCRTQGACYRGANSGDASCCLVRECISLSRPALRAARAGCERGETGPIGDREPVGIGK
jgi:hypothetical protein